MIKSGPVGGDETISKRAAVLSYANAGNFGDRLGDHLINAANVAGLRRYIAQALA